MEEKERERIAEDKRISLEHHKNNPERYLEFIPLKFRTKSFANFNGADEVKKVLKAYSDGFIRNIVTMGLTDVDYGLDGYPGSVLLTGKTGCGKTHLAVSIVRELVLRSCDVRCKFITAPELLFEIRATFNSKNEVTEDEIINKYSSCELLILDDLGAEKTSDFSMQTLYLIIDRRNRNLKPTIVTTNLSLAEIEEKIDARIASRLADMKVIKLNMPDYRKKR